MDQQVASLYSIRISGHLGPAALSAFESMVSQLKGEDTLLTGVLDRSALCGVLAEIDALGLDLVELRRFDPRRMKELDMNVLIIGVTSPSALPRSPSSNPHIWRFVDA